MKIRSYIKGDKIIWIIVLILLVISLLSVYSSTGSLAYQHQGGNTVFYLFRQLKFILLGLVIIFFVHLIPYRLFSRLSVVALYISIPLLILTVVILGLTVRGIVLLGRKPEGDVTFSILFWGFVAAVLGFLGQCSGLYNGLTAISRASEIDPRIVQQGLAESFSTTLWGGALLLIAGIAWFVLGALGKRSAPKPGPAA